MLVKHIFILIFSLAAVIPVLAVTDTVAQVPVDPVSELITYQEVVQQEGTKDELFNRCVYWLNEFYANPVSVTRVRDQATGVIKGQHQLRVFYTDSEGYKKEGGMVQYDFVIELKEDRYRYTIDNFLLRVGSRYPLEKWLDKNDPNYDPRWDGYLQQINAFFRDEWIPALKRKMEPEVEKKEAEW